MIEFSELNALMHYDDVLHKCLKVQENLHNAGQNNWYSKIENILTMVDVTDWRSKEPSKVVKEVKLELYKIGYLTE